MPKWTENQELAIDSRGGSILVSAAAGSGKTAALVERVIRRITDPENPTSIDRILIVTFTNLAAAELKDRISKKLTELLKENPDNAWYRRQLMRLPLANISTVDSFCTNLVKEFSHELSISDDYRIADEGELSLLKQDALRETFEYKYDSESKEFHNLVEALSTARDDSNISRQIFKFYDFLCSHPFSDLWLREKLSYYEATENISDTVWGRVILRYVSSAVDYCIELTNSSFELLREEPDLLSKVSDLLGSDLTYLNHLKKTLETGTYDEAVTAAQAFNTGRLNARGYTDHPVKIKVARNRDVLKATVGNIKKLLSSTEQECIADIKALYPLVAEMFSTVKIFEENFSKIKREKNVADFSDISHWALNLLVSVNPEGKYVPTKIAPLVSDRFDEVMVDEYQDANEVQDLIYHSVSHQGKNLFAVGDVKQSIYGFRQAMPEIFLNRKNKLPLYSKDDDNYPAKVILEKNFRSRKEVTDYVNFTFKLLMSVEMGDLEYNTEECLVPGAEYSDTDSPCVELHLIDMDALGEEDAAAAEARYLGKMIYKMRKDSIADGVPTLNFGDFAIVMRSANKYADLYARELKRCGVPAVCSGKEEFLSSDEVALCVNFLKIIDNPLLDIPLASVLMSPIYGFTPDEMAQIRCTNKKAQLYVALCEFAETGNEKSKRFLEDLGYLRTLSFTESTDVFVSAFYEYTNFISVATAFFGKACVGNLKLLVDYAAKFEQGVTKGLSAFVSFLTRLEYEGSDLPASVDAEGSDKNAVRIMSVHASKGLEFPVCIIANTHRMFISDSKENVLLHGKLGFASKRRDNKLSCNYSTMPRDAISLEIRRSEMSEELRVLYVAMTRAKEKLIMVSANKNLRSYVQKTGAKLVSSTKVSPYVVRDCTYLSDWLLMCALLHPASRDLRSYASMEEPKDFICEYTDKFKTYIFENFDGFENAPKSDEIRKTITFEAVPKDIKETIKKRFDYVYPNYDLTVLPQKVTASELAHKESADSFSRVFRTPRFMSGKSISAAEKGTALHLFLENCDYSLARKDLTGEISRLISAKILTLSQAESLDLIKVKAFINSSVVTEALKSEKYIREYKFMVNIPAKEVKQGISEELSQIPVVLQGAVDLIIIDEDGITVVDYKTDRVNSTEVLAERYAAQLHLYKTAVEQIFNMPVKKCLIYSIYLSEIKEV
ncbi:MAG: helicase-exonuclease AddAB subunit AddA [Eubacteriales bacterium]|nr:helicase-exonuclease AddAB subunit AddA [Eubacteriales bacterium]